MRTTPLALAVLASSLACASHLAAEPLADEPAPEPATEFDFVMQPDAVEPPEPAFACVDLLGDPGAAELEVPTYADEPRSGACHRVSKSIETQLREDVREQWNFSWQPEQLDVELGCDRLGPTDGIRELTLQSASGHGHTLDLARLRRDEDGDDWDLLVLRYSGHYSFATDHAGTFRGRIAADELRDALDYARAALTVQAEEPEREELGTVTFSSGDFHAYVRLAGAHGGSREAAWVGYTGSDEQERWISVGLASWSLWRVIDAATQSETTPDADSREFFGQRFAEARARDYYDLQMGWWIHARLVAMVADHGTVDLVPELGAQLCDADHGRYNWVALEAFRSLHELAGVDVPPLPDDPEPALKLIADWARRCGGPCSD